MCSLTAKLEEHLASLLYRASPYYESLSAPSFHDYVLVWGIVCVKFLQKLAQADAKTLILVSMQLLICLQFLLWQQQTANDAYMTTCLTHFQAPIIGLQ